MGAQALQPAEPHHHVQCDAAAERVRCSSWTAASPTRIGHLAYVQWHGLDPNVPPEIPHVLPAGMRSSLPTL